MSIVVATLPPIFPDPVKDFRTLDFTADIAASGITITDAEWSCTVAPDSGVDDPDADVRVIGATKVIGQKTQQLVGTCIEGVTYLMQAQIETSDGRTLIERGYLTCVQQALVAVSLPEGAIPFDYEDWLRTFPEMQVISEDQAQGYWDSSGIVFRNDSTSPEQDPTARRIILNALTAHFAALFGGPTGGGGVGGSALAGMITSKSVNGVSVGSQGYPGVTGTQVWYLSTRYGALFWKLTAPYRTFRYVPGPQRFPNSYYPYYPTWPRFPFVV